MVHRGNQFQHDSGKRRNPPGRAVRPLNKPISDTNNTLVQTDRGVFVCPSALTQTASRRPDRNPVNHVNPVQHKGSVRRKWPPYDRPKTARRFFAPSRLCVRHSFISRKAAKAQRKTATFEGAKVVACTLCLGPLLVPDIVSGPILSPAF